MNNKLNPNRKIGIGIAGLGFGEKVHLEALKNNPNFEPVALWHHRLDKLNDSIKNKNLKGYNDWDLLLNDKELEALIIATPPKPRFKLALSALEAGKHLLLEKPVGLDSNEIAILQKIALQKRLSVSVDFEYRAVPLFMQAKKIIETEGLIGEPWLIKLDWLMSSRANTSREWNWYSRAEEGGGVIGALGTHAFDLLHWLIGKTFSVNSLLSTAIKKRPYLADNSIREVTSEDICLAQLELVNNQQNIVPAQVTLSAVSLEGRGFWLEIYGSNGTLILGSPNQKDYVHGFGLWYGSKGQSLKSITPEKELNFSKTWEDGRIAPVARIQSWWSESIRNNSPIIPGLAEGLESQKVCDAIKDSANSSQRILIN